MATFTAIKNATQSGGAMRGVLNYIKRKDKTLWEGRRLVTGWNCVAQSAYDEMMTIKRRYDKSGGRMFYQFVQSFHPEEDVTPEEVHAIGLELAQRLFPDFEVVVATHVDADHLHSHLIVNSVSYATGRKLHQNAADLQRQRQVSDEICAAHGLTVLPPQRPKRGESLSAREYRAAAKGRSWKFRLMSAIEECMRRAGSREAFIREMERQGYQVRWEDTRKYITYTTPKGKKCRDDRLHEDKYRKEVMEREFRIREQIIQRGVEAEELARRAAVPGNLSHAGTVDGAGGCSSRPVPGHSPAAQPHTGTEQDAGKYVLGPVRPGEAVGETDTRPIHDPLGGGTGWEQERAAAFASAQDPSAGAAYSHTQRSGPHADGLSGVGDPLIRLGHRLEQSAEAAPGPAPVTAHSDRKTLAKERSKKIAQGYKPDDHEGEQGRTMTMK